MAESTITKPQVVFVLGGPGAGKGTQCENIVREFKFHHFSAGELLRQELKRGSEHTEIIKKCMTDGTIVPVDITCNLLLQAIKENNSTRVLVDGFPRNQDNLDGWERIVGDFVEVKFCLFLVCSEEVCTARALNRETTRTDDTPEVLKKRFNNYFRDTMPIIEHFKKIGKLQSISSEVPVNEVFDCIKAIFSKEFTIQKSQTSEP